MSNIKFGCQTYTWQMSLDKYAGKMDHILQVVKQSGMTGVEAEVVMMGPYMDPALFRNELAKNQLDFAALTFTAYWPNAVESEEEKRGADAAIDFVSQFPGAILCLCQLPGENRENLSVRQQNVISCLHAIAERALKKGVKTVFHANSPTHSIFRTAEDYKVLTDSLNPELVTLAIDTGHMFNGNIDVYQFMRDHRSLISHVHFKDLTKEHIWTSLGKGISDFPAIVDYLDETGYDGWIMIEEESADAVTDPDGITIQNGAYILNMLQNRN